MALLFTGIGIFLSLKSDDLTKYCLAVAEKGMQLCENQSEKVASLCFKQIICHIKVTFCLIIYY